MTAKEFINKWKASLNYLGLPSVGIHVGWEIIPADSGVDNLSGKEAWERIYDSTPPWFKSHKTFRQLVKSKNADYLQIVKEETENGKIEYYRKNGLREPHFCAFTKKGKIFTLLGDGNHRFLDCLHLIHDKNKNFDIDIRNATLDIINLQNFDEVLLPKNIWPNWDI